MYTTAVLEPSVLDQLSVALTRSLKRPALAAPVVYEQNDCVVVEMPSSRVQADALDLRLEGDYTLVIGRPNQSYYARVALPARISLTDSVIYSLGGTLSMTFVKADVADALEADEDSAYAFAMAIG